MDDPNVSLELLLIEILEQQAFLSSFPAERSELPEALADAIEVVLEFEGARSGMITMASSSEFPLDLAANVLGLDGPEDVSAEDAEDAVKELLNVFVGQILGSVSKSNELYEIAKPRFSHDENGSKWAALMKDEAAFGLLIEDSPALISIDIHRTTTDTESHA